ncbi:glycosyltransferase family 2 protein [Nocardioides lijunqiniae]|uniref:glycosyltransferase family 2 protein n=1 Tax=Nocardioides lijunqiniae TaxID=2760832 RepID=UPI0030B84F5F
MVSLGSARNSATSLVSVVCTTYNRGAAIRRTLASVLAQSVADLELLVVSDGSTDDTHDHVAAVAERDPRVRLIVIEHGGVPSRAMNAGISAARGDHLAYIDHDDEWTPEHLAVLLRELEDGADLAAAGSTWVDPAGELVSTRPSAALFWHPDIQVINPVFENSQAAHRTEWIERVGPWREEEFGLEDWDMWLRMSDAGARVSTVETPTVRKTMARSNRHRSLPQRHVLELVRCPSVRAAWQAARALSHPTTAARLAEAAGTDAETWYQELAATDRFVFPRGFAPTREEAVRRVPEALRHSRDADRGLEDPVSMRIEPDGDGAVLVQDISCMTAEHAARYARTLRRAQPTVFAIVDEVTADWAREPTASGVRMT